jgi:hypothetical protein
VTADEVRYEVSGADVRAAAERWARAAGVPVSVALGPEPAMPPASRRFLRGLVLGAAVGALLLFLGSGGAGTFLPWVVLALAGGLLVPRILRQRGVPGRAVEPGR